MLVRNETAGKHKSSWQREAEAGERVEQINGDYPYARLHWWERAFPVERQAQLDESRALRESIDALAESVWGVGHD